MEQKQLIIIAVKGKMHKQIFGPALAPVIAKEKKHLKDSGNWKGWLLQIRSPEGYKVVPILIKKPKTYEEKRAA